MLDGGLVAADAGVTVTAAALDDMVSFVAGSAALVAAVAKSVL